MTSKERTAILRILIDVVKADCVIDKHEMDLFALLRAKYSLSPSIGDVDSVTLSDACLALKNLPERDEVLSDIRSMVAVDGQCTKQETLLFVALQHALTTDNAEIISVNVPNLSVEGDQVLYVESKYVAASNKVVCDNFRLLSSEFRQVGLNFVYLPKVAEHFQKTDSALMVEVCRFLAPNYDDAEVANLVEYAKGITTSKFCKEQLYGKLGMASLYETNPALLVPIGTSFIDGKLINNFLKIEFEEPNTLVSQSLALVDEFKRLLGDNILLLSSYSDAEGQFPYNGYFKQLFDIYLLKNCERSSVLIDLEAENVFLPEVGRKLDGPIHTKEKAYYVLTLVEMCGEGLCFRPPVSVEELADYNNRLELYQRRFALLYRCLGGSVGFEPDLSVSETRQQMKSRINKYFKQAANVLYQGADYLLQLDKKGVLSTHFELSLVKVKDRNGKVTNLTDSELYKTLLNL